MGHKHRRAPDLFAMLWLVVAVGLTFTILYQMLLYHELYRLVWADWLPWWRSDG